MNADLKEAFTRLKPVCDLVMVCPTAENIISFTERIAEMKLEAVQELQQYILFPFITHLKSEEMDKKYELQNKMTEAMRVVLEKVKVNSFEMCFKIESALLSLVFDNSKPGMIADVPEELKLSVMQALTALQLNLERPPRETLLRTQVPTIAQAVFVSVHIAKLEKLRKLRLSAIDCLTAHTVTHPKLTNKNFHIPDPSLELLVVDTLSHILPGLLATLQDVANCKDNPGHGVVMAALNATHRIMCLPMLDKYAPRKPDLTAQDFARVVRDKTAADRQVSEALAEKKAKFLPKRSLEWYNMAGEKLAIVTRSLVPLSTHEHVKVRQELTVLCNRILQECSVTMQPSVPIALDVLISLSKDDYKEVSEYSANAVNSYLSGKVDGKTLDSLTESLIAILNTLPRILNNIDSSNKLSALNLLHGYIQIMCDSSRPQRLTTVLSAQHNMQCCCNALLEAAAIEPVTSFAEFANRDVMTPSPSDSPWCKLRHLDTEASVRRLGEILRQLGGAESAELLADSLLEMFHQKQDPEIVYTLNGMLQAENSPESLAKRILNTYIEENVWYLPLEVGSQEAPLTAKDTLDVTVYNPREWTKDSVPDLYEGAVETRYTDISYLTPRAPPHRDPNTCANLADAQRNLLLSCLLTEGVGIIANRLKRDFQQFLLKTLCLILERVGSKYEMLHLAGLKAIQEISTACGHESVTDLMKENADYFTHQITVRLKKAWNSQTALQILTVVMEFSDNNSLDYLYGIVEDVLVQSCDKYYEKNLECYLQVFFTFIVCIQNWFPKKKCCKQESSDQNSQETDILKDLKEFIKNKDEVEKLLNKKEEEESGKSVEEMYQEDMKKREEELLDYDDKVIGEKPPLPQHIRVIVTIVKRCINFVTTSKRDQCIQSMKVISVGFNMISDYEDEYLPLVHSVWGGLVSSMEGGEPVVMRRAFELLVIIAQTARDFIRTRTVKEILPHVFKYLRKSAADSYLKDVGSAYRNSQAFFLQHAELKSLPFLVVCLELDDEQTTEAMSCVRPYLSNKQPKPLQVVAVQFFREVLQYNYGAAWHFLRKICDNDKLFKPPRTPLQLKPIIGTINEPRNSEYTNNIESIFIKTIPRNQNAQENCGQLLCGHCLKAVVK